jgi:nucleoside-diphosphate-sugar epimerase
MKILITGATGFFGSALTKKLVEEHFEVIALIHNEEKIRNFENDASCLSLLNVKVFLENPAAYLKNVDLVIHAAVFYDKCNNKIIDAIRTNIELPARILDAIDNTKKLYFLNIATVLDPMTNNYSFTKSLAESLGNFYSQRKNINFISIRSDLIYGPYDKDSKFTEFIINACIKNSKTIELSDGKQQRNFIYIDDVVEAYFLIIQNLSLFNDKFKVLNLFSDFTATIKEFALYAHDITSSSSRLEFGKIQKKNDDFDPKSKPSEIFAALGWKSKVTIREGIKKIIKTKIL